MPTKRFELKVRPVGTAGPGTVVEWEGSDGENAARRYVDMHRDMEAFAWRDADRHGVFPGMPARIIE